MIAGALSRRGFLALAGGALASACVAKQVGDTPEARRLQAFLRDASGVAALGAFVHRDALGGAPAAVVAPAGEDAASWFKAVDDAGFAAHVRAAALADHQAGRTIDVDGWVLARTEAALCALAHDVL